MTFSVVRPQSGARVGRWKVGLGLGLGLALVTGFSLLVSGTARVGEQAGASPIATLAVRDVHALVISPESADHVLFGHHDGILESRDGGRRWRPLPTSPQQDAMSLTPPRADGGAQYLAGHEVFLKSTDGGKSWQPVASDLPGLDIHAFAQSPTDPQRLYAYVVGHGFFRSDDGGERWQLINPRQGSFTALAIIPGPPERLLAAASGLAVYVSDDGGKTFVPKTDGIFGLVFALAVHPHRPEVVYAGASNGLYRSEDGGERWQRIGLEGIPVAAIAIAPSRPDVVMAVDRERRVYRSEDGGRTWG
jgi:photosystem II stability/assembly factor-like uncharacterized protein